MIKFVRWMLLASALAAFGLAQAADFPVARVNFSLGKAELPADAAEAIKKVADFLSADATAKVQVSGFTDGSGDSKSNAELAKARALAVAGALKDAGVGDDKIVMQKPEEVKTGGNPEDARRVELTLAGVTPTAVATAAAPVAMLAEASVAAFAAPGAAPAAAVAPAAAASAPVINKGDTAWMIVATAFVIMMSVPGLALFYGGLVRSKNMLSVLMQVMVTFSMIAILWCLYGYSLAFTEGNAFIGGFDRVFMKGLFDPAAGTFAPAATFSKGVYIPELLYLAFQATFAAITCCLIVGAFAERAKFSAVLAFMVLWFTFSYVPMAHMVWYWMGPDAYTGAKGVKEAMDGKAGLLWQWGALDFAGGTVVHINAAVAGLVGAFMIGKRVGYGKEAFTPHSLTLTMVGASLLWVGWFGFNAGSALEANGTAVLAFANTFSGAAAAVLAWCLGETLIKGKASMLGAASGAVAGLVAITPACGNVGLMGAIVIGFVAGLACLWGVTGLKKMLGADDSLDVFGVHGVGGIVGALLTGVFHAQSLGGPGMVPDWTTAAMATNPDGILAQVIVQAKAVGLTVLWSGVVSVVAYFVVDKVIGLRVNEEDEREGLDISSHGETAYHN